MIMQRNDARRRREIIGEIVGGKREGAVAREVGGGEPSRVIGVQDGRMPAESRPPRPIMDESPMENEMVGMSPLGRARAMTGNVYRTESGDMRLGPSTEQGFRKAAEPMRQFLDPAGSVKRAEEAFGAMRTPMSPGRRAIMEGTERAAATRRQHELDLVRAQHRPVIGTFAHGEGLHVDGQPTREPLAPEQKIDTFRHEDGLRRGDEILREPPAPEQKVESFQHGEGLRRGEDVIREPEVPHHSERPIPSSDGSAIYLPEQERWVPNPHAKSRSNSIKNPPGGIDAFRGKDGVIRLWDYLNGFYKPEVKPETRTLVRPDPDPKALGALIRESVTASNVQEPTPEQQAILDNYFRSLGEGSGDPGAERSGRPATGDRIPIWGE